MADPIADLSVGPPGEPEVDPTFAPVEDLDDLEVGLEPATLAVDPDAVRGILEGVTGGLHFLAGHPEIPDHWRATDAELEAAAGPLARLASRSPVLVRAVGGANGDVIAASIPIGQYVIRNVMAAREVAEESDDAVEPEDGHRAPGRDPAPAGPRIAGLTSPAGGDVRPDGAAHR